MGISYIRYTGALTLENFNINNSLSDSAEFAGTILMLKLFENRFINTMNTLAASVEDIKAAQSTGGPQVLSLGDRETVTRVSPSLNCSHVGAGSDVGAVGSRTNCHMRRRIHAYEEEDTCASDVGAVGSRCNYQDQVRETDRTRAVSRGGLPTPPPPPPPVLGHTHTYMRTPVSALRALPPVTSLRAEAHAGAQAGGETDSCVLASIKVCLS